MKFIIAFLFLFTFLPLSSKAKESEAFFLVSPDRTTSILFDSKEKEVVKSAVGMFTNDMRLIAEAKVSIYNKYPKQEKFLIVAGTIGNSQFVDSLISNRLISPDDIKDKWEAFKIITYSPKYSAQQVLLVVGSDSRGTAYGIMELSRLAGVSPWIWWADVIPDKQKSITIPSNINMVQFPSVQYRGIFLNDEDWGIEPWGTKTLDKATLKGALGPVAYQKVFELLLRLRANTIWPAMHESTVPFYLVDGNKEMADRYGIVVGTSHCEPMMRCSASEWYLKGNGEYNYASNSESVDQYWTDRVKQLSSSENIYTLGMRGVHDGEMLGATTVVEQVELTNKVLKSQRKIIAGNLNSDTRKVPQVFIPYKEVLEIYNTGKLELPEDVSLIWCDDNFGYVSRLSSPQEQQRGGGSGIYYHASYWGSPHDYLWLCTTPPAQVYTEMRRAWDYQARKLWILNVGDIKPAEYITELFLDMAWNINSMDEKTIQLHAQNWMSREFGKKQSAEISEVMKQYYHLATIRKPEHMGWSRVQTNGFPKGLTPAVNTEFNPFVFGNELQKRIEDYQVIEDKVEELTQKIAPNRKDAFFQLVKYPVQSASLLNKKLLYAQMYRTLAPLNLSSANGYAELSQHAYDKIIQLTDVYNNQISDGKWNGILDSKPRNLPVFERMELPLISTPDTKGITMFANGYDHPIQAQKDISAPTFIQSANNSFSLIIYEQGTKKSGWKIVEKPKWINLTTEPKTVDNEYRIRLNVDWKKLTYSSEKGQLVLECGTDQYKINLEAMKTKSNQEIKHMTDGYVAFKARDYSNSNSAEIKEIEGLGHSAEALELQSVGNKDLALEYNFISQKAGEVSVCVGLYPNHPANGKNKRYAVAIDNEVPQIVETETDIFKEDWKVNVLRNQSRTITIHTLLGPGKHVLKLYALDPDIILDQIMVDFNMTRKFYQIPE